MQQVYELKVLSEAGGIQPQGADPSAVPDGFGLSYDPQLSASSVLSDGFGRRHNYLRISLVEHCNLRCRYCMPEEGLDWTPDSEILTDAEVIRLAGLFVAQGVDKIRLTGGEPLLRKGLVGIATAIGSLKGLRTLAITTNGLLLRRNLGALQRAGLNLLNISLDTLQPDRFEAITRRNGLHIVVNAIDLALEAGYDPVKVNCVVMRGVNEDELIDFVRLTRNRRIEVRFIEFMPFDGNRWDEDRLVSFEEMLERITRELPLQKCSDSPNFTARLFQVPGYAGRVGFITSMTDNFCEGCNRLRITADGKLKVCLFGRTEVSLRDTMRAGASDNELLDLISAAVGRKHARHAGMHAIAATPNRPMITIGG